jgi:hypothetical protein
MKDIDRLGFPEGEERGQAVDHRAASFWRVFVLHE